MDRYHFLTLQIFLFGECGHHETFFGGRYRCPGARLAKKNTKNKNQMFKEFFFQKIVFCMVKNENFESRISPKFGICILSFPISNNYLATNVEPTPRLR
jgi:hypothetical protein